MSLATEDYLEIIEVKSKCSKCNYYYPTLDFNVHIVNCKPANERIQCLKCNCDYLEVEIDEHADHCNGFDDMVLFISEHSRKKYSLNSIRKLLKFLQEAYQINISGRDVLRTINDDDFNISNWISFENEVTKECPMCMNEVPIDDICVVPCADCHKICYDCLYHHSLIKLKTNSILSCPNDNCKKVIHHNELKILPFPRNVIRKLLEKYDRHLLDGYFKTTKGTVTCSNNECDWSVELNINERDNIKCKKCEHEFCSICRSTSHYRSECNEVLKHIQEWVIWCDRVRNMYKKPIDSKTMVNEHYHELKQNFEKLKTIEEFKIKYCKLCPNCNRLIKTPEKNESVKCGENLVNGCGEEFSWHKAKLYESKLTNESIIENFVKKLSKTAEKSIHYPFKCDNCHKDIIGIRFECINCECINYCEECEIESTFKHRNNKHIFKIIPNRTNQLPKNYGKSNFTCILI